MLREARAGDLSDLMRLYRQLNPGDPLVVDGSDATFSQIMGSAGLSIFVVELDDVVVATTYLNVIPNLTRSASPYAVIENVVVEESLRGMGIGKQIMEHTLQAAWNADCYKVMLMTGSGNPGTQAFYRACGLSADYKTAYTARRPDGVREI
jgi:GNAT superfamily N-acetyltransferase